MLDLEQLKFPIGKTVFPETILDKHIVQWIKTLEDFPTQVEKEIKGLNATQFTHSYRPKSWTILQIINHCVDSHANSILRFKLALTENNPTIVPYQEALWAELPDTLDYSIKDSLMLLKSLHKRWVFLLSKMSPADFKKTFFHPENNKKVTLEENLCIYDWHCKHHLQHIINAKKFKY